MPGPELYFQQRLTLFARLAVLANRLLRSFGGALKPLCGLLNERETVRPLGPPYSEQHEGLLLEFPTVDRFHLDEREYQAHLR